MAEPGAIYAKLAAFAYLAPGWHYGRGGPIAAPTLRLAASTLAALARAGLRLQEVFPGADGQVSTTAMRGDHELDVMVEPDGTLSLSADGLTLAELEAVLAALPDPAPPGDGR